MLNVNQYPNHFNNPIDLCREITFANVTPNLFLVNYYYANLKVKVNFFLGIKMCFVFLVMFLLWIFQWALIALFLHH